jgi:hypothetical protein
MGPYWVLATLPVTVRAAAGAVALDFGVARAAGLAVAPMELGPVPLAVACGIPVDGAGADGTGAASE